MKVHSFLKSKLFLSSLLSLSIVGCNMPPKDKIIVSYGALSVSTPILDNATFEHQETLKSTVFSLSGKVENLKGNYLTHIDLSIKNENTRSTQNIKTSVLLTKNEQILLGGSSSTQLDTSMINGEIMKTTTTQEDLYIEIK